MRLIGKRALLTENISVTMQQILYLYNIEKRVYGISNKWLEVIK